MLIQSLDWRSKQDHELADEAEAVADRVTPTKVPVTQAHSETAMSRLPPQPFFRPTMGQAVSMATGFSHMPMAPFNSPGSRGSTVMT